MNLDNKLLNIVLELKNHFDGKKEIMGCFCNQGVQLEGWLKGELLYLFSNFKKSGDLSDFDREVKSPISNQKIDFRIEFQKGNGNIIFWLEIKHWLIGYQKGYKYNANFYFGDPTSVGIKPDVEKLSVIKSDNKYMLILTTANPGREDWLNGIQKFSNKFSNFKIESLTDPNEFEDFYFLGLLKIISQKD